MGPRLDWKKGRCFWASAKGSYSAHSRGLVLCVSDQLPFANATPLYPKPDQLDICGRILVIRAQLHHRDTILIGLHGDNSAPAARLQPQHPAPSHLHSLDTTLAASISHLNKIITNLNITPSTDIFLMADHNHRINLNLDYHSAANKADTLLPASRASFNLLLAKLQLVDTFRILHPHTRAPTSNTAQPSPAPASTESSSAPT